MDDPMADIPSLNMDLKPIPIQHEIPKTTLDSLLQIRGGYAKKLEESQNDAGKKRRFERAIKQYDAAIKATKEGKTYNYKELVPLPGYADIPMQSDGRPIMGGGSSTAPATTSNRRPVTQVAAPVDDEEDIIAKLSKELDHQDVNDDDDDDGQADPEEEKLNKQLKSVMPAIGKLAPAPDDDFDDDDLERELAAFTEPSRGSVQPKPAVQKSPPQPQQPKTVINKSPTTRPMIDPNNPTAAMAAALAQANTVSPVKQRHQKEIAILAERQRLFKEAALQAKRDGNVKVALVYLKHAKGFEQMINAAENGLPLDMTSLPVPPQLANQKSPQSQSSQMSKDRKQTDGGFEVINMKDVEESVSGDRDSVYKRLIKDLTEQIKLAAANSKHFSNMGDVQSARKFAEMAREAVKDLDSVKSAYTHNQPVPLYHYEKRTYQTVDCNSDLTDNDLEITVVRGINLPLPKDFDAKSFTTYVKFDFPYPPEDSQSDKTNKQTGTLNPEYNQQFKLQIQRTQAKFARMMNRKDLKLEIYYKAGIFKSDKVLGTCSVKLQPLESTATIHDAFDLLDGRRQIGSKLEVKIRIREPLLHKQVKVLEYKWLIVDKFVQNL